MKWYTDELREFAHFLNTSKLPLLKDKIRAFAKKKGRTYGATHTQYYRILHDRKRYADIHINATVKHYHKWWE